MSLVKTLLASAITMVAVSGAVAQDAPYFKGKNIDLFVAGSGALELHSRLLAPYLQKHIPGEPNIIVRSMPGAGGMILTNHLYNVAPRDGTAIANFLPYFAVSQAVGAPEVMYDATKFNYLGSIAPINSVLATWNATTEGSNFGELKTADVKLGATSKSSITYIGPTFANRFLGTEFQIVMGYQGTAGIMQAIEAGELNGRVADYEGISGPFPHWLTDNLVTLHFHTGLEPDESLPGVPRLIDLAKDDHQRGLLEFLASGSAVGRVFAAPPEVPADVMAILEAGFAAAVSDPEYVAFMDERRLQVAPKTGAEVAAVVDGTVNASPDILKDASEIFLSE